MGFLVILKITRVILGFFFSLLNLVFSERNIYNMVDSGQRKDKK
jgi:hypothetical protein